MKPLVLRIDPDAPDSETIESAARIIQSGGVIAFPTLTLYGIGVDALNSDAVNRVFQIKKRSKEKPLSVLIGCRKDLEQLVAQIPPSAVVLMDRFWPGRLTLIFDAAAHIPHNLTAGTGKIGIRLPGHPVAAALVAAVKTPVTATSANLSGEPGCSMVAEFPREMLAALDAILDAGTLRGGIGSSIVDVTTDPPTILREGEIPTGELLSI